jgi:predicted SprT family Zn-dependent metalloprotease
LDLRTALIDARRRLHEHGLHDWTVGLDRAKRRAGACYFASRTISLSRPLTLLHDEAEVRDTVLHEIAHALVGPAHGHDAVWQAKAREIGCTGTRCLPADAPKVDGNWTGTCPAGHAHTSHRRPERVRSCPRCAGSFDPSALIAWTWRHVEVRLHPKYVAELVRLADRGSAPASEQLATDELLGGGRQDPLVQGFVAPPLRPGTQVRVTDGRFTGRTGTLVSRGRTRSKVQLPEGVLSITPGWITADD